MFEHIATYRQLATLVDGTRVLLRPLTKEDKEALGDFFSRTAPEDLKWFRNEVRDRRLVERWVDELDYRRVLPLVAIVNERIVGDATLHFGQGPMRHIAELRIFLDREFRQRGLGNLMHKTLIDLARRFGLQQLKAEIVADQAQVIKAVRRLGFEPQATFSDYFMTPDGDTHDVTVLILKLARGREEF